MRKYVQQVTYRKMKCIIDFVGILKKALICPSKRQSDNFFTSSLFITYHVKNNFPLIKESPARHFNLFLIGQQSERDLSIFFKFSFHLLKFFSKSSIKKEIQQQ